MGDSNMSADAPEAPTGGSTGRRRLTPVEIQQKEFRLAFRGYNEREVDEFLDEVTEEVARLHADNRRLREELESRRTVRLDAGSANEADDLIRGAREQAARIVAEAEADAARIRGAGPGAPSGAGSGQATPPPEDFLARERQFLQNLATLIQGHASAIKDELRRSRETPVGSFEGEAESGSTDVPDAGRPDTDAPEATTAGLDDRAATPPDSDAEAPARTSEDAGPPTQAWLPPFVTEPVEDAPTETDAAADPEPDRDGPPEPAPRERPEAFGTARVTTVAGPGSGASPGASKPTAIWTRRDRVVLPSVAEMPAEPAEGKEKERAPDQREPKERSLRELFWGED